MSAVFNHASTAPAIALAHASLGHVITGHATLQTAVHGIMVRSKRNVRKKATDVGELAALIRAQGLLQNLVGYKQVIDGIETGIVEVVAGGRRLEAIGNLIAAGDLPLDFQIPYLYVTADEAIEISLAENLGREAMHPADLYEAMLELSVRGRSIEDIAIGFNVDAITVKRRLKLANISPRLLDLYRNDEANFDQMMALAISDDHAAQEQAWDGLNTHSRYPHELRRLLTAQQINAQSDRLARFVGVEAFEEAGGVVTRDLFSNSGAGYISDAGLLERLALAKMEQQRTEIAKEGHGWIEIMPRADHVALAEFGRVRISVGEFSAEQKAELESLEAQLSALEAKVDELEIGDAEPDLELQEKVDRLSDRRRAIQQTRINVPNADDKALAGAVITVDDYGNLIVKRDLIRPVDKAKMVKLACGDGEPAATGRRVKAIHSDRLTRVLTSHRTAGLQAEMMDRPDVALVVLTHTLLLKVLMPFGNGGACAKVTVGAPALAEEAKEGGAAVAFAVRRQQLLERLPSGKNGQEWLAWLYTQPQSAVLELMAFCVASSLDTVQEREGSSPAFGELARALKLDMSKWWKATAADYFDHVSKDRTVDVLTQAISVEAAVPLEKMKKGAAAEAAERALVGVAWLPEPLRAE